MPLLTESPQSLKDSIFKYDEESDTIKHTAIGQALLAHFQVYKDVFKAPVELEEKVA